MPKYQLKGTSLGHLHLRQDINQAHVFFLVQLLDTAQHGLFAKLGAFVFLKQLHSFLFGDAGIYPIQEIFLGDEDSLFGGCDFEEG